jgi:TolB-like protein
MVKMKNLFFVFLGLLFIGAVLNAQSLDEAIISAAIKISGDLPANTTLAVLNFRSDSEKLNDYVINELYGAILRNRRIVPVKPDQSQLQSIRGDLATVENKESAQRIGRLLGAQYLVTGSIQRFGSEYKLNFTAIDTNAEIKSLYSASLNPQNDSQFALLLGISTESASVTASAKSQKSKQQDEIKNWISFNLEYSLGICLSYEYMLNPKISLGANVHWGSIDFLHGLKDLPEVYFVGIDAAFRFYPWGKTFFLGTALGFIFENRIVKRYNGYYSIDYYSTYHAFGLGITPEIGWKIDVGKKGGMYLQFHCAWQLSLYMKDISDDPRWFYDAYEFYEREGFLYHFLFNNVNDRLFSFGIGYAF